MSLRLCNEYNPCYGQESLFRLIHHLGVQGLPSVSSPVAYFLNVSEIPFRLRLFLHAEA